MSSGSVVISKSPSVLVAPSSETAARAGDISLSWYDKVFGHWPVTVVLVFEHAIPEAVESIKRGLSQALVHYYPLAGRFAGTTAAGGQDVFIKCSGEGVSFVAASANCTIKEQEAALSLDASLQQELATFYRPAIADDGRYCESDPLLLMQVTVFSCGGFALGVTWSHAVADGIGIGQFLQAVGELARGLPLPSVMPVRQDDLVLLEQPPISINHFQVMGSMQPSRMAAVDITIKQSLVDRVRGKYASINSHGRPCTVFEAVGAVLWRCRTRAIMSDSDSDPEAMVVFGFGANARKQVGAKQGYYGNCVMARMVTASSGAVASSDVMDLVKTVQRAKEDEAAPDQSDVDEMLQLDWYKLINMTSWRNIGLEAPDFGGGRPARVKCHWRDRIMPCCIALPLCNKDDDYNVLSVCVTEDHVADFLHELADMHLSFA